jgi:DNA polymerase-3 subunit delta
MMEGISVLNDIKRGVISLVYLFYGPERFLLEETLGKLTKFLTSTGPADFNYEKFDGSGTSPAQVVAAANLLPVFAEKRLVVVTNPPWFSSGKGGDEDAKSDLAPLLAYLDHPAPSTCLVFVCGEKIDGKRKTVKAVKKAGQVIEFTSLKGVELNRWMEKRFRTKGKKVSPRVLDYLALAVGNDLSVLEQEIEKAVLYVGPAVEVTMADVMKTVSAGSNLTVFNMTDAVSKRDPALAVLQLRELVRNGEPELKVLALLATQMRNLIKILELQKKGLKESEIAGESGLHPFVVKKGLQQCKNFSIQDLVNALEILLEANVAIKIGKGEPLPLLETAVLKMCQK